MWRRSAAVVGVCAPDVDEGAADPRADRADRAEREHLPTFAGDFDDLIKTRAADMTAYRELVGAVMWSLPGVRETHTYALMEEVKNTTSLAL